MLNQFALHKQCAVPHVSNVFLPTCSATAITDYVKSVEAASQFVFTTDNPIMDEYLRRDVQDTQAERANLRAALKAVNNPWYKAGKAMRKFILKLVGKEDKFDPDMQLAEELLDNSDQITELSARVRHLMIDIYTNDYPNMVAAYLDGVSPDDNKPDQKALLMMQNFEYAEGGTVDMVHELNKKTRARI